ncbi:hypothetical protein L873DRAFT_1380664 [Choiromyces venosus 120613-1]|uniref:Uncharacterized protein n=1 Tax=Choiromyces venosus 120613-1 TaxID=1336337 RepID=A0A3N4JE44_9PEZI|nr:hypothetical protein L873DRAFT_1380664 [Choiromyces venosus 120613-1]
MSVGDDSDSEIGIEPGIEQTVSYPNNPEAESYLVDEWSSSPQFRFSFTLSTCYYPSYLLDYFLILFILFLLFSSFPSSDSCLLFLFS